MVAKASYAALNWETHHTNCTLKNVMKTIPLVLAVITLCALDTNAGTNEQLEVCRQQIDSLDQRIVDLIQQRARVVEEVGNIKREAHLPVTFPAGSNR
jgi:methyl coenzyme M reductase subunit D